MTDRDRTRARRAAALALHPDVGGDAARFAAALDAIDRRFEQPRPHIRRSRTRAARTLLRRIRTRIPNGRRYITL